MRGCAKRTLRAAWAGALLALTACAAASEAPATSTPAVKPAVDRGAATPDAAQPEAHAAEISRASRVSTATAPAAGDDLPCDVIDADVVGGYGCAVTRGGSVYCWGDNSRRQLGRQDAPDLCAITSGDPEVQAPCSMRPLRAEELSGVVDVAVLGASACALRADGQVLCWGNGAMPTHVEGIEHAKQLAAWGDTCALEASGVVKCWDRVTGIATVPGIDDAVQIAGACALRANGAVACWGANDSGLLGTARDVGDCDGPYNKPCSVDALPVAIQHVSTDASSGWQHACAVAEDGTLECWGHNGYGQLGRPAADSPTCVSGFPCEMLPRRVPDLSGIARVFAGIGSTCALTKDGRALCWGNLPDSYVTNARAHIPRQVELPGKVKSIANDRGAACFVLEDGSLYCYGLHFERRAADGIGELVPNGVPHRICVGAN